jgi:hypothetical protein
MDRKSLILLAIILPLSSYAEVYKCADGKYQSDPCDESSQPLMLTNGSSIEFVVPEKRDSPVSESAPVSNTIETKKHPCAGVKVDRDEIRFRNLAMCMTEAQMLSIAGPQQYSFYEYYRKGRHYKQYYFSEPRAGFASAPLVEDGFVVDIGSSVNSTDQSQQ